mmetsp:Transcript_130038/g.404506  ORF Transcript_130038/g.404506 Transcript_130038/m.404506 type:complete len:806 (+) Transcript_130038:429-2846(+)
MGTGEARRRHIRARMPYWLGRRQAAAHQAHAPGRRLLQTYDAFARVSMSIGVNQLMLAMSYYILGYALTQVHAPIPAFAGVIVLMCAAEVVAQIDLTLPVVQQRLIQILLAVGPGISCLAGWHWSHKHELALRIAECLAPVAFFAHGIVIALLAMILRVREQENGAMLPLAFQGVLYLDVFGWVPHSVATPMSGGPDTAARAAPSRLSTLTASLDAWRPGRRLSSLSSSRNLRTVQEEPGDVGWYAIDYLDEAPGGGKRPVSQAEDGELDVESGNGTAGHAMPAVDCVVYGDDGRPVPTRPEEMAKQGSVHDLRLLPGAPRMTDTVNALEPPAKEFWSAVTFMPPESRRRRKMDEFLADSPEQAGGEKDAADPKRSASGLFGALAHGLEEDTPIVTGHDNEMPGVLPWQVFKFAAVITSLAWILGGVYFTLHVNHIWTMELPWWWEVESHPAHQAVINPSGGAVHVVPAAPLQTGAAAPAFQEPGVMGLWAASLPGGSPLPALERVDVSWPYPSMAPRGLACDSAGQRLLVTDGLSAFVAELRPAARQSPQAPAASTAHFRRLLHCPSLMGTSVEDVALVCGPGNYTGKEDPCEALVLHGRGRRLAACPLTTSKAAVPREGQASGYADGIAGSWLRPRRAGEPRSQRSEQAASLLVDPDCAAAAAGADVAARRGCTAVATTQGRVAQLQARASGGAELVPMNIFEAHGKEDKDKTEDSISGRIRAFNGHYLGILQPHLQSIRVLDSTNDGAESGVVFLPGSELKGAFCAGGGHLYLLGQGPSPGLWRFALPEGGLLAPVAPVTRI